MTLPLEQTEQIKQQIIQQIEEMNESELENFLAQNNLIKTSENEEKQCIFCSIVSEKIPGYKISENDSALAVLEINPVSKGHTLIIPKVHVQEISKKTQDFAEEVSIKLKEKLNAKSIQTEDSEMFGHKIVNIIPIYDNKTLEEKRQKAPKKVLEELQKELEIKEPEKQEEVVQEKKPEIISDKNTWLPKRIP